MSHDRWYCSTAVGRSWVAWFLSCMQKLYGPVVGTLFLGALWGLWHLPFFFGPLAQPERMLA